MPRDPQNDRAADRITRMGAVSDRWATPEELAPKEVVGATIDLAGQESRNLEAFDGQAG